MLEQAKKLLEAQGLKNLAHLSHHEAKAHGQVIAHLFRLPRSGGKDQGSLRWRGLLNGEGVLIEMIPTTTSERKRLPKLHKDLTLSPEIPKCLPKKGTRRRCGKNPGPRQQSGPQVVVLPARKLST